MRVCFDTYREHEYKDFARRNFRRPRKTLRHCREVGANSTEYFVVLLKLQVFNDVNSSTYQRWNSVSVLMIPGFEKVCPGEQLGSGLQGTAGQPDGH